MSSMLKKTGGLSFKPKVAPRRPVTTASTSAPSSGTPAPIAEASSEASTPAPTVPPVPPVPSVESSSLEVGKTLKETRTEALNGTPRGGTDKPSAQDQQLHTIQPVSRSVTDSAASSVAIAEPQQAPSIPTSERTAQPTPAPDVSTSGTPPATHPDTSTSSVSTASPPVPSRLAIATSPLTPGPSAPIQRRVAPPTAPPSPARVSDTIAVSAPAEEPPVTAPKKRAYRKRTSTTTNGDTGTEGPAPKKRRAPKKATPEGNETAAADGEQGEAPAKEAYRRRRRSPTPEDPENQTVDHGTMKMAELTRDLGIGKKFKHADAIAERAREARERFRQKKIAKQKRALGLDAEDDLSRQGTPAIEGEEIGRGSAVARARELGASIGAQSDVGYEVIDGQIIINQQSLVVDRHAAHRDRSTLETVEEDEFSHLTTSSSFRRESRRTGANHWTEEETEKFYRLLGMFGTDFETIASMFPEKTRRAVKLKFNREENQRPRRIDATVMVRGEKKVNIDLEEYKAHQTEWQESDKIMAEHNELVKEHNEDIRRLREERRAAGLIDDDDDQLIGDQLDGQAGGQTEGQGDRQDDGQSDSQDGETALVNAEVAIEA
ncbi:hypothetical protein F4677DRAFT_421136 [Hypoxylon crocopeplum]|nr:hypothetical protein F4677DRAFT_421136 [Hypoxylon crocopeplum]